VPGLARALRCVAPVILLVEDHAEMRLLIGADLRAAGHSVVELSSAEDAKTWLHSCTPADPAMPYPELVISDLHLADGNGLELLECIREALDPPRLILITAFPSESLQRTALGRGVSCVLAKPFALAELREAISQVLDAKDSLRIA